MDFKASLLGNLETVIEKASVIVGHSPEKAFPL